MQPLVVSQASSEGLQPVCENALGVLHVDLNALSPELFLGCLRVGFFSCFPRPRPLQGAWRPSLNISTLLTSIQLLMAEPNPDDPLMADIVRELLLWPWAQAGVEQSIRFGLCFHFTPRINALGDYRAVQLGIRPGAWRCFSGAAGTCCTGFLAAVEKRWRRSCLQASPYKQQCVFFKQNEFMLYATSL